MENTIVKRTLNLIIFGKDIRKFRICEKQNMKKVSIFLALFGLFNFVKLVAHDKSEKREIIIFTCHGGGGHVSAANSIADALKENYKISIIDPFIDEKIFGKMDFIKKISFSAFNGIDFYNYLLRNRWNWLINLYSSLGKSWVNNHKKKMTGQLQEYFNDNKCDMVICVSPYINGVTLNVLQDLNIPFLLISTDLSAETFVFGVKSQSYKKFILSLPFDDELLLNKIKSFNIPKNNIDFIGYPLRSAFFQEKNKSLLKKEFKIPEDKKVVMILMGAEGSPAIWRYVFNISKNKFPMHLIICIGRNEYLRKRLSRILFPKHITNSIFGFTDRIADLMAISDLFITKPGSHSVCEAIQMGIPILIDQTSTILQWEKLNGEFIKKYKLGDVIRSYRKTNKLINKFLNDENYLKAIRLNFDKLKRKDFKTPLRDLVNKMLN